MISEAFCELHFEDAEKARLHRTQWLEELQAQDMACTVANPYRIDDKRIYLLTAEVINSKGQRGKEQSPRLKDKDARPIRSRVEFKTQQNNVSS